MEQEIVKEVFDNMIRYSNQFVRERDWERFHTPKNLSLGVMIESAELNELFHWLSDDEIDALRGNPEIMDSISDEIADVFHYLLRLSSHFRIDIYDAFFKKLEKTKLKYPIELSKGKNDKYTSYEY